MRRLDGQDRPPLDTAIDECVMERAVVSDIVADVVLDRDDIAGVGEMLADVVRENVPPSRFDPIASAALWGVALGIRAERVRPPPHGDPPPAWMSL